MPRVVRLNDVWQMLDVCLPGHERIKKLHRWNVKHGGRVYHEVPLGRHGMRTDPEIEAGHIRGLVRFFKIDVSCYAKFINLH
ncbi:MAG: hypothetical protein HOP16_12590 [Acidobacteria bacterium]|nr:hypothetical protein [Acidobacteriota bacterium]